MLAGVPDAAGVMESGCTPQNQTGKARLKFHYTSMHLRFNSPNIVKAGYGTADSLDWEFIEVASSENNKWKQAVIDLPENAQMQFRIEGIAFAGSILAIDNIEVEQEADSEEAAGEERFVSGSRENVTGVYSPDGIRRECMMRGLNILKEPDGTFRKVSWK